MLPLQKVLKQRGVSTRTYDVVDVDINDNEFHSEPTLLFSVIAAAAAAS